MTPIYVDPFLGAASVWLALLDPRLVAPCAWMGGKRRLAEPLLRMLGLEPGRPVPAVLGDASWWGWVWPLLLDEVSGPVVCRWLLSWRGEEPRALWFRLRDAGPPADPIERAAGLLWLQARAASGVPVWWQEDAVRLVMAAKGAGLPRPADMGKNDGHREKHGWRAFTPADVAGRLEAIRRAAAPRPALVDRWMQDQYGPACIHKALTWERRVLRVEHRSALDLTREWAPILGDRARVYLDPPYQGATTGYPATCPRDEVLAIADTWARHGARVVLSEACGLAAELGAGWTEVCLRRAGKPEWATVYGGQVEARHGRLFAAAR